MATKPSCNSINSYAWQVKYISFGVPIKASLNAALNYLSNGYRSNSGSLTLNGPYNSSASN